MSEMECNNPHFEWNAKKHYYGPCTSCGNLAWDHPQADPVADIKNTMRWISDNLWTSTNEMPIPAAPVMRDERDG